MKLKLPSSVYNWITLSGATLALISLFMIVFLFFISFFMDYGSSYLGLVIYIILPAFMIAGLILIPIGMLRKHKKDLRLGFEGVKKLPYIDLNEPKHRNAFFVFIIGSIIVLFGSAIGSYEAFHLTETTEFCGELCHDVMHPEYIAYQNSSHARVRCVDCHVGTGADWYVKSKMSGLYQVYAVVVNNYPKPIPTPIKNLRPARETCERCHWPEKFYARKLNIQKHYISDEENSEWDIYMMMKIGPTYSAYGLNEGIHWHINPNVKIEYISTDNQNLQIPWVRYTDLKNNIEYIFESDANKLSSNEIQNTPVREMDCMDCHNRPSHVYMPPAFFVDNAITSGAIPQNLPEIKYIAMDLLEEEFTSYAAAEETITNGINEYYRQNYPEIFNTNYQLIEKAINGLLAEFNKNIFPEMKVRWDKYPNHIGHVEFDGCFRCHNDVMRSEGGRIISKDCNLCHSITAQGPPDKLELAKINEQLDFRHPLDIGEEWRDILCTECHTGLNP